MNFGMCFDIDGVLLKGNDVLRGAVDAIGELQSKHVPHVFLTNNGMMLEKGKADLLSKQLGLPIAADQMNLCHTALQEVAPLYQNDLVLVTGYCKMDICELFRAQGFKHVATLADYAAQRPYLLPNKHYAAGTAPSSGMRVAAVIILETPQDWHEDLQVCCDVLRSDGVDLGNLVEQQEVKLYCCNYDFIYPTKQGVLPRLGPGAFLQCLEMMYRQLAGRELQHTGYGKPFYPAYRFVEKLLKRQQLALSTDPAGPWCQMARAPPASAGKMRCYMVGDNPKSDIRGARAAKEASQAVEWRSILVRTGCFQGGENDPEDPADYVVDDVLAAVKLVVELEGAQLAQLQGGGGGASQCSVM